MYNEDWETKKIKNKSRLKNFNLNLILTRNIYNLWKGVFK